MDTMKTILTTLLIAGTAVAMTLSAADAASGCGHGWHWSARWGHCVRNHHHMAMMPAPMPAYGPPPPMQHVQTITAPARTGIIPGQANAAHSVCAYNYHPNPHGDCVPN